jgi:hypothetical protein
VNFHGFPEERGREEEGTDEFHDALTKTPEEVFELDKCRFRGPTMMLILIHQGQ